jgi:hypothetical protein
MKPDIQIVNPLDYPNWDDLLLSCPDYSFFHSTAWSKVLRETYRYSPTYFTIFENGHLQALVPVMQVDSFLTGRRGVSLPFTDYSDAIISDGISFNNLFDHIIRYGEDQGWKSLEIRGGQKVPQLAPISFTYCRHILDLRNDTQEIFSSLRDNTKRNIKKAIKQGVKVEISSTLDSVKGFHRLNVITRKRHGLPPQPFHFFEKVYEHIISKNLGFVVLASYKDNIIAGAVFFHLGEKAVFKYGASNKKFHHLRPNNLVMWKAIKWFSQNGYKSLCFGRTEPANDGLRKFKAGWDTKEKVEKYYKYSLERREFVQDSHEISKIYQRVFRKMPMPLLRLIGSLLYRHVG